MAGDPSDPFAGGGSLLDAYVFPTPARPVAVIARLDQTFRGLEGELLAKGFTFVQFSAPPSALIDMARTRPTVQVSCTFRGPTSKGTQSWSVALDIPSERFGSPTVHAQGPEAAVERFAGAVRDTARALAPLLSRPDYGGRRGPRRLLRNGRRPLEVDGLDEAMDQEDDDAT